jgi:hypothetical protein
LRLLQFLRGKQRRKSPQSITPTEPGEAAGQWASMGGIKWILVFYAGNTTLWCLKVESAVAVRHSIKLWLFQEMNDVRLVQLKI